MTNLQQWLWCLNFFAVPYISIVSGAIRSQFLNEFMFQIQVLPLVLLVLFGFYAMAVVIYRTLTFNDCPLAAKELQLQIELARKDLIAKGFKFRD